MKHNIYWVYSHYQKFKTRMRNIMFSMQHCKKSASAYKKIINLAKRCDYALAISGKITKNLEIKPSWSLYRDILPEKIP